ncbi:MAG TPA: hypothetical protein PKW35_25535, partial [Nannocystaceae bacterium]|nr:hypothetical protein [Nannocystaceae bacterium]
MTAARKIDPSVDKYRQERLADFTRLRTKLEDSCESIAALVPEDEVRERALAVIRPELRAFLSIVLTRAPLAALERAAGLLHDWHTTDKFFDKGNEEIQKLIAAMLPQPTWTKLEIIDAKRAKNDDEWARWCSKWLKEFGTHTKVQHEPGRWARFFSGIEAPWWIVQAVSLAETVDAHMRQASRERAAANEARRPMTLNQVVAMKGGTVLRPEDAVAALRGTYQHGEPSPPAATPAPAPAPAATPPTAPAQIREPTRDEMIASLGHLTKLRGTHLLPPRDPQSLDLFYRWSHDAWTAIQAHAAALEWTDATPAPPSSLSVRDGMIAMAPLAVLRGRPFRLPFGADHEAFYRWCLQEWTGIQAHAAALEWKPPPAPSPDPAPTPDPPQAPEDEIGDILGEPHHAGQTPEAKSVEARVTTIEDEIRRLRSELVFLDLNFQQHVAKVQEEREEMKALIQRQFAEIHHLLTQILGKTTVAATVLPDAVPLATGSTQAAEPDT